MEKVPEFGEGAEVKFILNNDIVKMKVINGELCIMADSESLIVKPWSTNYIKLTTT
jgi:hypothetical protein